MLYNTPHQRPFQINPAKGSRTLVVAFTNIMRTLHLPPSEFFKQAGYEDANQIIISDKSRSLCLTGISEQFDTFEKVLERIRKAIRNKRINKLIITGHSAGASTAIIAGHILKADRVIAFCPFTYLDAATATRLGDIPFMKMGGMRAKIERALGDLHKFGSFQEALSEWNGKTEFYIHFPKFNRWDRMRAQTLKDCPGVTLVPQPYDSHQLITPLVRDNVFQSCFQQPGTPAKRPLAYLRSITTRKKRERELREFRKQSRETRRQELAQRRKISA